MSEPRKTQDGGDNVPPSTSHDIQRVGIRVPPFYPEKPALWFHQLESQFFLANITSDTTKFHHAMGQLDPIYASEVEDIIAGPPAPNKYERLKSELIRRLSASKEKKILQLVTREELGDRKPSQFLRHIQHLAGPDVPDDFLRTMWSSRLPNNIQTIVASQSKATLDEVAELADRIHDIAAPSPHVAAATAPGASSELSFQVAELTRQVQKLTTKLDRMSRSKSRRSRSDSRDRSNTRSSRSQSSYRKYPLCWYHAKFGEKASRCTKPCDYKPKGKD